MANLISVLCTAVALVYTCVPVSMAASTVKSRQPPGVSRTQVTSSAHCDIKAGTELTKRSAAVVSTFASELATFICDSTGEDDEQLVVARGNAVAASQAEGFARAVASIAVDCSLSGMTSVKIDGRSVAMSQAELMATAVVDAVTRAEVCGRCSSEARLTARRTATELLAAVAIAEVSLADGTMGTSKVVAVDRFSETVVNGSAQAIGQLLASAAASLDGSCGGSIEFDGSVDGNTDDNVPPAAVLCSITSLGIPGTIVENATADAFGEVIASACDRRVELSFNNTVREIATAAAIVVALVAQECDLGGGGTACSFASIDINETASAAASATALGLANAISTCQPPQCVAIVSAMEQDFQEIIVSASQSAFSDICSDGNGVFNRSQLVNDIVTESLEAFAAVVAQAIVDGPTCMPTAEANATVTPTPSTPPQLDVAFPILPDAPAVGGPNAEDPGTRGPNSFTNSDSADAVAVIPGTLGPGVTIRTTANTTSGTEVSFDA